MKNIIEICKDFGIEIPAEKHADFLKAVNGEYKTVSDYNKQVDETNAEKKENEKWHCFIVPLHDADQCWGLVKWQC